MSQQPPSLPPPHGRPRLKAHPYTEREMMHHLMHHSDIECGKLWGVDRITAWRWRQRLTLEGKPIPPPAARRGLQPAEVERLLDYLRGGERSLQDLRVYCAPHKPGWVYKYLEALLWQGHITIVRRGVYALKTPEVPRD